jgi:exonuclease III
LDFDDAAYFVASVYLPDNSINKEADEVVRQLFGDIEAVPDGAHVIVMGDWNFDPFKVKGKNKDAFKKMMTHPRLALVHRSSP